MKAQIAVSLNGMNALYPSGVENTLTVVVSDLPDSNVALTPSLGEIYRKEPGKYVWTICHRDATVATLTVRDAVQDTLVQVLPFRVFKIPEPEPVSTLGTQKVTKYDSKSLPKGEFCRQGGIAVLLSSFDFDLRCEVVYYDVQHITKGRNSVVKRNLGPRFNSAVIELVQRAVPGDQYHFYHFAYRCGCDPMVRHLSEVLHYSIK